MTLRALAVVIPARDEADLIAQCLESVGRAIDLLGVEYETRVAVTVVADGCRDRTVSARRAAGNRCR